MKILTTNEALETLDVDVLALQLGTQEGGDFSRDKRFKQLDDKLGGALATLVASEQFKAKAEQQLALPTLGAIAARTLLLVGAGDAKKAGLAQDRAFAAAAVRKAAATRGKTVALAAVAETNADADARVEAMLLAARLAGYRFDRYRTKEQKDAPPKLAALTLVGKAPKKLDKLDAFAATLANAVCMARDLINEPASVINPESFAKEARRVAKEAGLELHVLEPKELEKERFGMLLAVGQGSYNTPRVVHLSYKPKGAAKKKAAKKKVALIGKGVTFDSGGLSLKPANAMEDMKIDMSGGAAVLAAMAVVPSLGLDYEVHGLIGLVENMPSGRSYRPGDVLHSRKGTTVEVNNTDAEGRLVLGDVFDYAREKLQPSAMIDLATLTGACMVALGPTTAGMFTPEDKLAEELAKAAKTAGEDLWRLPLTEGLRDQLKSDVADMKNTGDRMGGAITAALFLKEFAGDTPWVHLDIAGPASSSKDKGILQKGGTGFGVATLIEFLRQH